MLKFRQVIGRFQTGDTVTGRRYACRPLRRGIGRGTVWTEISEPFDVVSIFLTEINDAQQIIEIIKLN